MHRRVVSAARRLLCTQSKIIKVSDGRHCNHAAVDEARAALTEYLHSTRSLPFTHADIIASNSPSSLLSLLSGAGAPEDPGASFPRDIRRFLSYHPINEFDFFFESIGIPPASSPSSPSPRGLFLAEDAALLDAVTSLVSFGFPWSRLGILYANEPSIFRSPPESLLRRLAAIEALGLRRLCVVGVCLAFPGVLARDMDPGGEIDLMLGDIRRVFLHSGLDDADEVDALFGICRRIKMFYDAGIEKGAIVESLASNCGILFKLDEGVVDQRFDFYSKLGVEKDEFRHLILSHPEMLNLDLENTKISMPEYLKRVCLSGEEVAGISKQCPFSMGKNKLSNLPGLLRAMGLREWFTQKFLNGNLHYLSPGFASATEHDMEIEEDFIDVLTRNVHTSYKLEFLLSIGFGENKLVSRAVGLINSTRGQLQQRFSCLLEQGIDYPMLCRMINTSPKLLNQGTGNIQQKVKFLQDVLDYPLRYLENFPAFLCFDLENRTVPRYAMLNWLKANGLLKKSFSRASVLSSSERKFIVTLRGVHPAAPKVWLEIFASRTGQNGRPRKDILAPSQVAVRPKRMVRLRALGI